MVFTNEDGVSFSGKKIIQVIPPAFYGEECKYHYEGSDTPWMPVRESRLSIDYYATHFPEIVDANPQSLTEAARLVVNVGKAYKGVPRNLKLAIQDLEKLLPPFGK